MSAIAWGEHCGRAIPDSLGDVYSGKKAAHFAAEAKPILAIAVFFFAVSQSRTSKREQNNKPNL